MNEKIKKFIAFASAAAMFVCLINPEISFAASDTRASVRIGADQPEAGRKALSFDNFNIPLSAGKITSSHYYGSPYTVINIQDLHCHPQVQRNIAKIIDSIDKQYALDKVYLEGASTNAASGSLSDFMKTEIGKDVVETLVDEGYISGTEYYSLINEKNEIISAIEEKEIYDANIELLNAIISAAPKVEEICLQMLKELSPVIKEYSNSDARKLERIIRRHENKKIDSGKYYLKLIKFAKEKNIDVSPYKNISAYAEFSNGIEDINRQKVSKQMGDFLNILKSKFSYEEFNRLSAKSANFSNLEDIASDLVFLSEKYSVFENNKFYELQKFFTYLRFLTNVNPMEFADEEKAFVEELKLACVADEYEAQIVFLADFIPEIKRYFTANITPQELEAFDARFKKFKEIWCSYFSENSWRELDKYADILKQYHANNIKRDKIFSDIIVRGGKPGVKVMVTGGFHSKGLEEFLQKNAVNYILITPKVNGDVASAYETYLNVIKSYKSIIKNAINIKPFYENAVNESLPNLIGACFKVLETKPLTLKAKEDGVKEYINIYLNSLKDIGGVYVSSWQIDEYSAKEIKFSVTYADKRDLSVKVEKTYTAKNGKVQEIKQSGGSSSNSSFFNPLSIINPFFKNTKTKSYRFYTFIVIPVLEEFVFRFLPFTAAGFFFAESMLFAPFAITIAGMLLFAWGHKIADDIAFKTNSLTQKRNYFSIGVLGLLLSGVYSALFIIFPSAPWIALTVTLSLHSINNILSYLGIIKNPMLSMIKQNTLSDKPETAVKKYLPDTVESLKKVIDSPYFNDISPQLQEKYKDIVSHFEELVDLDNNYDLLIEASELAFEFISSLESQAGIEEKYIRIVLTKLIVMSLADIGGYIYGKDGVSFLERLKDLLEKNKYYVERKIVNDKMLPDDNSYNKNQALTRFDIDYHKDGASRQEIYYVPDEFKVFSKLPESVLNKTSVPQAQSFSLADKRNIAGNTVSGKDIFDHFFEILENNTFAMSTLNTSKDIVSLQDTLIFVSAMIDGLEHINKDHAEQLRISLKQIEKNLPSSSIDSHKELKSWHLYALNSITGIHTLINAVHQTSITDFMSVSMKNSGVRTVSVNRDISEKEADLKVFDFSMQELKPEVMDFLSRLDFISLENYENMIMKDGVIIYTLRLVHSVDALINLNSIDDGIRISFNESGHNDGNKLRTLLFAVLLSQCGMDIIRYDDGRNGSNISFQAVFNASDRFDAAKQYADVLNNIVKFSPSSGSAYDIEPHPDDDIAIRGELYIPEFDTEKFKKIKGTFGVMPEELKGRGKQYDWDMDSVAKMMHYRNQQQYKNDRSKLFDRSLENVWLADRVKYEYRKKSRFYIENADAVYDYFDIPQDRRNINEILRMFALGRIILNAKGELELNKKYSMRKKIINSIFNDNDMVFEKAQLLNLIDYSDFSFSAVGYIGSMIAQEGVIKTSNGYIAVYAVSDRERRRLKCADAEFVDVNTGQRNQLSYAQLLSLLREEGFAVARQLERSPQERRETIRELEKEVNVVKSAPEIRGFAVSEIRGYVSGKITYDKTKIDGDSIWVAGYTTPDDVESIDRSKGIITTSGGMLSHANITAREKSKSAVLIKERWSNGEIKAAWFEPSGQKTKTVKKIETQDLTNKNIILKEGDRVLISGENGSIIVFNDIDSALLDELQQMIDNKEADKIRNLINESKDLQIIDKIIEFIYFQTVGKKEYENIVDMLFEFDAGENIERKVKTLDDSYTEEIIDRIEKTLGNIENTADANIGYTLIMKAANQIELISRRNNSKKVSQLKKKINEIYSSREKMFERFIKIYEKEAVAILEKSNLTPQDYKTLVKLLNMASVWRNFHNYKGISEIVDKLSVKKDVEFMNRRHDADHELFERDVNKMYDSYELYIKDYNQMNDLDSNTFGSKAVELAKMSKFVKDNDYESTGIYVPYGIGLDVRLFNQIFIDSTERRKYGDYLGEFAEHVFSGDEDKALEISRKIVEMIEKVYKDNRDMQENTLKNYIIGKLDINKRYAVRTSGVGEDGASFAFPGMGETYLNVPAQEAYDKIKLSWISFFSDRAVKYMCDNKLVVEPSILIQEMVENVEKAGVIFTKDQNGDVVIEAVLGLGEGLVSGRVEPDNIKVRIRDGVNNITYRRVIGNVKKLVKSQDGGIELAKLTDNERISRILDSEMINRLVNISLKLENDAGYPVDLEYAIDTDGKIYILQRRPVTTFMSDAAALEKKKMQISLVYKDENALKDIQKVMSITNPDTKESSISVYFEKTEGNRLILSVSDKFDALSKEKILSSIEIRLRDKNVRSKLPYSVAVNKEMEIDPLYDGGSSFAPITDIISAPSADDVKVILSAA